MALVMIFSLFGVMPQVELEASAAYENTWTNTGNQRRDIVEIAKTQIGYHEGSLEGTTNGSNNYTKYNVDLYKIDGSYNYMWCQSFIAWCAKQAGVPSSEIKRTAGTIDAMDFFKSKGTWKGRDYTPQSGDIIYFYSSSSNSGYHVGIVSDVSNGQINTIEGNYSNKVATHSVALFSSSIVGYGCPNYSYDKAPTYAILSSNKEKYSMDEIITFTFESDYATQYFFRICNENGDVYSNTFTDTSYTTSLPAGKYSANMSAFNSIGTAHTGWINFEVYDKSPTYAKLSSDKEKYSMDETITFTFESDYATQYFFRICNENGDVYSNTFTDTSYTTSLPAGKYSANMSAFNSIGTAHTEWINFEVYDKLFIGDLNQDNKITISDTVILQKYILGIQSLTQEQAKFADITQDGIVNILDLSVLKHKILSL